MSALEPSSASEPNRLYFTIPAAVTGDLWHLSAALNLVSINAAELPDTHGFRREVCVVFAVDERVFELKGVPKENDSLYKFYNQRNNGAMTFNFLKNQGFRPLIGILAGEGMPTNTGDIESLLAKATSKELDELYETHKSLVWGESNKYPNFETVLAIIRGKPEPFRMKDNRESIAAPTSSIGENSNAPTNKKRDSSKKRKPTASTKKNQVDATNRGSVPAISIGKKQSDPKVIKPTVPISQGKATFNAKDQRYKRPIVTTAKDSDRVLPYMMATTLAVQLLLEAAGDKTKPVAVVDTLEKLSLRMSKYHDEVEKAGVSNPSDIPLDFKEPDFENIQTLVEEKINKLREILQDPILKDKKEIVFYNNRGNQSVNRQTNSNPFIFEAFQEKVKKQDPKKGIVVINTGGDNIIIKDDSGETRVCPTLDLYNKTKDGWRMPGLNPLATCAFFARIRQLQEEDMHEDPANQGLKRVFGIFSGRTGSVDVAAFNGVNTFWWDEPWIEWAANDAGAVKSLGKVDPKRRKFCETQMPQCLRTLQMHCFAAIGLPNHTANPNIKWSSMRDEPFEDWLKGLSPLKGASQMHYKLPYTNIHLPNLQVPTKDLRQVLH